MEMFGLGTFLRAMVNRTAARRSRQIERALVDMPTNVRLDMGLDQKPRSFVPRMLDSSVKNTSGAE
jgi:hypothetical protein